MQRAEFGRKLEPVGNRILHGAGQDQKAFEIYSSLMPETSPAVYMTYVGIKGVTAEYGQKLKNSLLSAGDGEYLIPQIGLSMTRDGTPEEHYEQMVARGEYDQQIEQFCIALKELGRPAYVRIGYEFNGHWNGYEAETYVQAYIRITQAFRRHQLNEVATVWCFSPEGNNKDFMSFYPGDEYVDWWSIDLFSKEHFNDPSSEAYMKQALIQNYPVMIGESTPRFVGVLEGERSWKEWFQLYFNFIERHITVKSLCYINWDWSKYPMWSNWGDGRLESNDWILNRYRSEMKKPVYLHLQDEKTLRKQLGLK